MHSYWKPTDPSKVTIAWNLWRNEVLLFPRKLKRQKSPQNEATLKRLHERSKQ